MKLRYFLLAAIAGPALAQTVAPASVGMAPGKLALITDAVKLNIAAGQIPGAIVLVARNDKIVHLEAQGFAGPHSPQRLTTETIFPLASLSKPITAVAVLMLVEAGKIKLDDPVSKYIPQLGGKREVRVVKPGSPPPPYSPMPGVLPEEALYGPVQYAEEPAAREITIRDLLTHTSGIQIFGVPNDFPKTVPGDTLATRLPRLGTIPLEFQPGARWAYSNGWGFDVLGRVVEVASGLSYRQFLHQRLWDPLGMVDTDFGTHRAALGRALPPPPGGHANVAEDVTYFSGAAGMASTVGDYVKFVDMVLDGGSVAGHRYLTPQSIAALSSNQIGWLPMGGYPPMGMPPEGLRFGYGVLILSNPPAAGSNLPKGAFGWDGVGTRRWWALPQQHVAIVSMVPLIGPAAAPLQRVVESAVMSALPSN